MASWVLVPCLTDLRGEFNALAPGRDMASDGSIGDSAHAQSSSDHNPDETGATPYEDADSTNEVHAIDVDKDLRKAGWSMGRAVGIIVTRHRNGQDDRLQNVIYNRVIYSRSWGWTARTYTGSNAHTEHAHFSARYTTAQERDTRPWGLLEAEQDDIDAEDDGMATISQNDFNARMDAWWNDRMAFPAEGESPSRALTNLRRAPWNQVVGADGRTMYQVINQAAAAHPAILVLAELVQAFIEAEGVDDAAVNAKLGELTTAVAGVRAAIEEHDTGTPPTEA